MSLRQIYPGPGEALSDRSPIDIIAVHGLDFVDASGRCSASSWRESSKEPGEFWLAALIRDHGLGARARLLVYEFNSRVTFSEDSKISGEANGLLSQIKDKRTDPRTQIIFLCHGLGGILVKNALVNASQDGDYHEIKTATRGVAFFGTPHRAPLQETPGVIEKAFSFFRHGKSLQPPYNLKLLTVPGFRDQVEDYDFVSFYSESDEVVPPRSAIMNLAGNRETQVRLSANHEGLCRIRKGSDDYRKVARNVLQLCSRRR